MNILLDETKDKTDNMPNFFVKQKMEVAIFRKCFDWLSFYDL